MLTLHATRVFAAAYPASMRCIAFHRIGPPRGPLPSAAYAQRTPPVRGIRCAPIVHAHLARSRRVMFSCAAA
ncbi:hypothetical protein D7S86_02430 [Pararobbsia silviterrae]|uniref:Uncharacterized protein n=1 Tax=Pararobbsia silviterrae TaxID=1792498 RepID=A0A494YFJ4_9BURK|nr:hypothetical protein D7S86_02430 [Pararobbsia silviterrae]